MDNNRTAVLGYSMPSGSTHDRITLWSLPLIATSSFAISRSSTITLLVAGGYLFGGLMFGPDLDIYSRQYRRWGWLRWIWRPYQQALRHRSFWSHGPIVGTVVRLLYLASWIGGAGLLIVVLAIHLGWIELDWVTIDVAVEFAINHYGIEVCALFLGLELGAMSHSLSDWSGSAYKRWQKRRSPKRKRPQHRRKNKAAR